jgi:nicotinamidase-related amidase
VRATALDAAALGFTVGIAHDACFDRSTLSHNVALHELDVKYAAVLDAATIAEGLATSAGRERA